MVIKINPDLDNYQESVFLGLTAKQLVFSVAALIAGGGIFLLTYKQLGITASCYIVAPVVAPIALGGFYSFNGMGFFEMTRRYFQMCFQNRELIYMSDEDAEFRAYEKEQKLQETKKKKNQRKKNTSSMNISITKKITRKKERNKNGIFRR